MSDIEAIRERHRSMGLRPEVDLCAVCRFAWPCDAAAAIQRAERAEAGLRELIFAGQGVLDWYEKEQWAGPHDWLAAVIARIRAALAGTPAPAPDIDAASEAILAWVEDSLRPQFKQRDAYGSWLNEGRRVIRDALATPDTDPVTRAMGVSAP